MSSFFSLSSHLNYSCSSYPTRASYSGQVDGFRTPIKNELKTRQCLKGVIEIISNRDVNILNLHIDKATKTRGDKQLYLITHFTKQTLNLNYLLLTLNIRVQLLNYPKQKRPFYYSRSMVATSCLWFTFNFAVQFRPKMPLTLKIFSVNTHVTSESRWPHTFPLLR